MCEKKREREKMMKIMFLCVCVHSGLKTKENSENGNVSVCRFTFINFWEQFYLLK